MQKRIFRSKSFGEDIGLFLPGESCSGMLFILDGERYAEKTASLFDPEKPYCAVVSLPGKNRLADYTPWEAEALTDHTPAFAGQGDAFIRRTEGLCGELQEAFPLLPRAIMGYSLGGLLAVYASFMTECFDTVISLSGSFWYPGWDSFIRTHKPLRADTAYLMLAGSREGEGKATVQGQAAERARLTHECLCAATEAFPLLLDGGGHHEQVDLRFQKAVRWLQERQERHTAERLFP